MGQAMGVGSLGEAATSAEISGPEEAEDEAAYEEESIVHHTASIGDAEVSFSFLVIFFFFSFSNSVRELCLDDWKLGMQKFNSLKLRVQHCTYKPSRTSIFSLT